MDPVCHTLVGATLAETGLKRRTALGAATLVIGANLPDLDILAYTFGPVTALWFRRGVTHGILGLLVLPPVLVLFMLAWDRLVRRRGGRPSQPAARPGPLLLLAYLGAATHPLLDFMNVYGMRWLMPFSDRWYYGDTLFIVDPWIWAALAAGIFLARKRAGLNRGRLQPAAMALVALVLYIGLMGVANVAARGIVTRSLTASLGRAPQDLMVAPVPVDPLRRWVVADDGEHYRFGSFHWLGRPKFTLDDHVIERFPDDPLASAATRGPTVRKFLSWARFPYYVVERRPGGAVVHIGDARYTLVAEGSWAGISVPMGE